MKLENLGTGHIVTFRNGFKAMYYIGIVEARSGSVLINPKLAISLECWDYEHDMRNKTNEEYDIMKVESLISPLDFNKPIESIKETKILWERPEVVRIQKSAIQKTFSCEDFVIVE